MYVYIYIYNSVMKIRKDILNPCKSHVEKEILQKMHGTFGVSLPILHKYSQPESPFSRGSN